MRVPAEEKLLAGDGGRSVEAIIQLVARDHFQLIGIFDHDCSAVAAGKINATGRGHWRRIHSAEQVRNALRLVIRLSRFGVKTRSVPLFPE